MTAIGGSLRAPRSWRRSLLPVGTVLGLIALLEICSRTGLVSEAYFPPCSEIAKSLFEQVQTSNFWAVVGDSLQGFWWGLLIAVCAGIPIGLVLGSSEALYRGARVAIEFLRTIPSVAVLPLVVLVVGINLQMKIYLVAFVAFWPILIQTIYGVHDVDPVARDSAKSFGIGPIRRFFWLVLPTSAPYIATSVRIAAVAALSVDIAAEMIVGTNGLGNAMNAAQYAGQIPAVYAIITAAGLLGWIINAILREIERRVLRWHISHRSEVTR